MTQETINELASILITNAELIPDPRREGATDCYAVTLDDLEALRSALVDVKQEPTEYALPDDALRHLPLLVEAAKGILNVYTWRGSKGYTAALKEGVTELHAALKPFLVDTPTTNEANNEV